MSETIELHPVQNDAAHTRVTQAPSSVTLRAYEVYSHLYGPQPALIDLEGRWCRGGFTARELIAYLYARSFPKAEWRRRVDQAYAGMQSEASS